MHPRGLTCFGSPAPNSTAISRRHVQLLYIILLDFAASLDAINRRDPLEAKENRKLNFDLR